MLMGADVAQWLARLLVDQVVVGTGGAVVGGNSLNHI